MKHLQLYKCVVLSKITFLFISATLRGLYFADNDFETFPEEVSRLKDLQIVRLFKLMYDKF